MSTTIPNLQQIDLTRRLVNLFPRPWSDDASKQPGGILFAIMDSVFGAQNYNILQAIQFIWASTRITTAYGSALDVISVDYFGTGLPRQPGESDTSFKARIFQALLQPRVTRANIQNAIYLQVGVEPTMTELWNPADASAYDEVSFFDIDNPPHNSCKWGDDSLQYQGLISLEAPVYSVAGGQPMYGYDIGAAYDTGSEAYFNLTPTTSSAFTQEVNNTIAAFKAEGTAIWTRYILSTPSSVFLIVAFTLGSFVESFTNENVAPYLLSLNVGGEFLIVVESPAWNTTLWVAQPGVSFILAASNPADAAYTIGAIALPNTANQSVRVPVNSGQTSVTVNPPGGTSGCPVITPNWNSTIWVSSISSTQIVLSIDNPQPGSFDLTFFPGSTVTVTSGSLSVTIVTTATLPYGVFVTPTWSTQCWITNKTITGFTVNFSNPPPVNSTLYWSIQEGLI